WEHAAELARLLGASEDVPEEFARTFWWGVARYERDVRGELQPAEAALHRTLVHDAGSPDVLQALAAVQRRTPGRAYVETLVKLSDARVGDLALLREAIEV